MEIGRRLVDRNLLVDARLLFEAEIDEAVASLSGHGPTDDELAHRWDRRTAAALADPPVYLDGGGDDPAPGASTDRRSLDGDPQCGVERGAASGRLAAPRGRHGSQTAAGPAWVVRHPEDLTRLVEGDVLIAVAATSAFNAVFPLLSAVVTEQGGLLSHAAILSPKLGLPAVVGVADLFEGIHDGDLVEVDPLAGTVRVADAPADAARSPVVAAGVQLQSWNVKRHIWVA